MQILLAIAIKSLLISGLALGLLYLLRNRSAAERSWVAHIGLLALVLLALAPIAMPRLTVEAPALFGTAPAAEQKMPVALNEAIMVSPTATVLASPAQSVSPPAAAMAPSLVATALYAVPAAILLFITFLALARLIALRARAEVLVDGHWLSALARAQRRMGFKHGTALLTSDDLSSPISWGLMRPVILLNSKAVEASGEAEAIIAHELAHVARMDWAKLLLARIATALFWFNPLVWVLAREAHQLREETADDAVLAADIVDTDYAQLLVGVARHECPGLLLGAHGVAPSKGSLNRRIRRVLDVASVRGPVARPFALGVFAGAVLIAAPLAALTFIPAGSAEVARKSPAAAARAARTANEPTDLPHLIATGVSASVNSAVAAVAPTVAPQPVQLSANPNIQVSGKVASALATARTAQAAAIAHAQASASVGRRADHDEDIHDIVNLTAAGVTLEYVAAMRAASPRLRNADSSEFVGLKSLGVTPQYVREMVAAGYGNLDFDELTEAFAVGVSGKYARDMIAAGVRPSLDDLVQLRAVGVPADFVRRIRAAGHKINDSDEIVQLWAVGFVPQPPRSGPRPSGAPPPLPPPPPDDADEPNIRPGSG